MRLQLFAPALLLLHVPGVPGPMEGEARRAPSSVQAPAPTALDRARELEKTRDWPALAELLEDRARRVELPPEEERLFAAALEALDRLDEAAHHMDLAAAGWERLGRDAEAKTALASVRRLDPLSARRDPFVRKVASTLLGAVDDLLAAGDAERALRIAETLPRITRGKDARTATELLARARAAFAKIELEQPGSEVAAKDAATAVVERETEHYRLVCHLEPKVVERLGSLMDDVHAFYVRVYFDGDAKRARGTKATIRIAPDKPTMLLGWPGAGEPEGWWSPGTSEVHAYDTRKTSGSLDDMLETMFHEASHQFMTLLAGGSQVPAWLNEGTSSFFEGTVAMADGRVLWPRAAERRLDNLRFQIASKKAPRLRDVVEYAGVGSYGPEYYAWGWGLVYYLQEYEDPATLEHVYRPLYAQYRDEVIQKGSASFELFERWFLGKHSPRNHPDFSSFERDWVAWILSEVAPLHGLDAKARTMRIQRIERLMAAANDPKKKKGAPDAEELLSRALVHFEWVRTRIDKGAPDAELLLRQAEVFERIGRSSSAAALIEEVLDLADRAKFALDDERREALMKRLSKLDRRNAALRASRQKTSELARVGSALIADYRTAGFVLRASTLAADLAQVLGEPLEPLATELRKEARTRGLLQGSIRVLSAAPDAWEPLLAAPIDSFEPGVGSIQLRGVRSAALVDASLALTGEYVVRATLRPEGERVPGWTAGLVVAGAPERAVTIVGIDDRGFIGLWTLNSAARGSSTLRRTRTIALSPAVQAGAVTDLSVRVFEDARMEIRVGASVPVEARLESVPDGARHAGVFVKNAHVHFDDARVELVP
mgnify:CR=1 FL=1